MSYEKYSDDDWNKAEEESKKAGQGMFLKLAEDGDTFDVYFIQPPITRETPSFRDKSKMTTKMIANVAVFSDSGITMHLLEMAPKHWRYFLRRIKDFGRDAVYKLTRVGVKGDQQVRYDCDKLRSLSDADRAALKDAKLITIEGADSEAEWLDDFRKSVAAEAKRLGWTPAVDIPQAVDAFMGKPAKAADMTAEERMNLLAKLSTLKKGATPQDCKPGAFEDVSVLDLDEESDFF